MKNRKDENNVNTRMPSLLNQYAMVDVLLRSRVGISTVYVAGARNRAIMRADARASARLAALRIIARKRWNNIRKLPLLVYLLSNSVSSRSRLSQYRRLTLYIIGVYC